MMMMIKMTSKNLDNGRDFSSLSYFLDTSVPFGPVGSGFPGLVRPLIIQGAENVM